MSESRGEVVVIGAGIVGVCCAIFLQRLGRSVTLVDRQEPGDAASFGNAGSLSWSSCLPIAVPGLLPQVPRWLLDPQGPLTVRWRHLPTLAPWLLRFMRSGTAEHMESAAAALGALHAPALDLHKELARAAGVGELVRDCGYHVVLADPGVSITHTVMETDGKFLATPMEMGMRFAGTVELATVDAPPDYRRADAILRKARRMFPGLQGEPASQWMGPRPSLPDGLPVIDRAPRHENVYLAFGHAHTGLVGGPNTGRVVAGLVCDQPVNMDLRAFRAGRFAGA